MDNQNGEEMPQYSFTHVMSFVYKYAEFDEIYISSDILVRIIVGWQINKT